jgi:hypothetical protein
MNYSITKHSFENRHFRGGGGGTCYSPPRRIAPKPSVSGIAHGVGMTHQHAPGDGMGQTTGVIFLPKMYCRSIVHFFES